MKCPIFTWKETLLIPLMAVVLDGFAINKVKHFVFACRDISVESFIQMLVSVHVAQESSPFAERKTKI